MNKYKLNQLYEISSGISKSSNDFGFGNPFLSFSTVFNNFHIPEKLNDFINTTQNEINKFSIKRGDVFITRTSEKIEELGKSCVALKNYENATYNGFCKRLRPIIDESIILPEYAQYLFRAKQFTNQIIYSSPMSTRASLNEEILNSVILSIHSLEEQQHIVDIIGSIDDKIENNNKIVEKSYKLLKTNITKMIGNNWIKLGENKHINFIKSGINKFDNNKIYLDTSSVSGYSITNETYIINYKNRPSRANMQPVKNSVWFAKLKNSPKYIIVKDFSQDLLNNKIFSTGFCGLKIDDEYFNILSTYIISEDFDRSKNQLCIGATMQGVNNSDISNILVPNFEIDSCMEFNKISETIYKYIYNLNLENKMLLELKNLYLKKFFS